MRPMGSTMKPDQTLHKINNIIISHKRLKKLCLIYTCVICFSVVLNSISIIIIVQRNKATNKQVAELVVKSDKNSNRSQYQSE